ncbi:MAG: hypothetical protein WAQ05_06730 [Rubrivivax sp.]
MGQKQQQPDSTNIRKFKGTTVFDWDAEPSEERPSEFAESSLYLGQTAISRSSGFHKRGGDFSTPSRSNSYSQLERARPRPPQKKGGSNAVWVIAIGMVLAITAGGLYGLMRWFNI